MGHPVGGERARVLGTDLPQTAAVAANGRRWGTAYRLLAKSDRKWEIGSIIGLVVSKNTGLYFAKWGMNDKKCEMNDKSGK